MYGLEFRIEALLQYAYQWFLGFPYLPSEYIGENFFSFVEDKFPDGY